MKPKRFPYSGYKKQSKQQITTEINKLKSDVTSITSRTNQFFSRVVGDTKISLTNNSIELEAPKITIN